MKGKGNKGDSKGWTAGKGWSEGKGWNTSSKGWEKQRPSGMNNLERDSKQYDVLVMETSILEKNRERTPVTVPVKHVAKLSRMRGSTEDGDNDTTPDCVGSKQLALEGRCQLQCNCCEDEWHAVEANAKSLHQKAKCTFFQLDRSRHQFLREGQYGHCASFNNTPWRRCQSPWLSIQELEKPFMPVDWLTSHPLTESDGSRANDFYTTADGSKVYNEGKRKIECFAHLTDDSEDP